MLEKAEEKNAVQTKETFGCFKNSFEWSGHRKMYLLFLPASPTAHIVLYPAKAVAAISFENSMLNTFPRMHYR